MFAIAFDLIVAETLRAHPKSVSQAYINISAALERYRFERIQGSVYVCQSEDMANLFEAITALRALPWFAPSVRDIRAFRIEQWSDFTPLMKQPATQG
jgi:virulence-associated protein VapD